ncbi:TPA: hypothetical protein ACX6Q7_001300 [Photobacterium damselae]
MLKNNLFYSIILLMSSQTYAITIDTMLKISDDNGTGVFSVTNESKTPSFVKIKPAKVVVKEDGSIGKIEYTKENLLEWEVSLTQNKVIVEPLRTKNIGIRSLCSDGCNREKDTVFAVKFLPSPYSKDNEKKVSININYGYESLFVIPASKPEYKYTIERRGDDIYVKNTSNSFIRVLVDQCNKNVTENCSRNSLILAGRNKKISLPVNARQNMIGLTVIGYDNSFYKKLTLNGSTPIARK